MPKFISLKQGLLSVLFWSIISAAFIGPGTVTTASKAGASFQLSLLWALVFSTVATIVLQEAAARISIASGKSLGEIIALKFKNSASLKWIVFIAVAFGCAAYQAGNMLGAISGIALLSDWPIKTMTVALALGCAILLWLGNFRTIANALGLIVAFMGIAFIYAAVQTEHEIPTILQSSFIPQFPEESSLLIIGLVGTTIVPYNLFLASGLSKGQDIREMRIGITVAVFIGGLISMAILLVGTQVVGEFSFQALADTLTESMGPWAAGFFGFGLFAAGMTSSITSPLAAAVTAQSLFGAEKEGWSVKSRNFRMVWGVVLLTGLFFGLSGIKPIPAIILAQALNGALLPIITIFLFLAVNDQALISSRYRNSLLNNIFMLILVALSSFLGITNVLKATSKAVTVLPLTESSITIIAAISSGLIFIWMGFQELDKRK